jgi:hypothetical protein
VVVILCDAGLVGFDLLLRLAIKVCGVPSRNMVAGMVYCVAVLIGFGLFLPLVSWLCGGVDLDAFSMSKVALAIWLPKSLGNHVAWV